MSKNIKRINETKFDLKDISYWVIKTMEDVEKLHSTKLSGLEKKKEVIARILDIVDDDGDNAMIQMIIPQLIDSLVEIDGHGLKINEDVAHDAKIMFRGLINMFKDLFRSCGCLK